MDKKQVMKYVWIGLGVFAVTLVIIVGWKYCQNSRPYSELDTRYQGVFEIDEKAFEELPILDLGE